jgi:hypothetical protein
LTLASDSGALRLTLTAPNGATVGTGTFEMAVADATDGSPRDGLTVSVVPWMPAMGHGTAPSTVTAEGGGRYRLDDVYLFMPGSWELEIGIAGPVTDHANASFQIQ